MIHLKRTNRKRTAPATGGDKNAVIAQLKEEVLKYEQIVYSHVESKKKDREDWMNEIKDSQAELEKTQGELAKAKADFAGEKAKNESLQAQLNEEKKKSKDLCSKNIGRLGALTVKDLDQRGRRRSKTKRRKKIMFLNINPRSG